MRYNWSKKDIEKAVKISNCFAETLRVLHIPDRGRNLSTLKSKILLFDIDISHFDKRANTHNGKHSVRLLKNRTSEDIFKINSRIKRENLKREYIKRILKESRCEICGISNWNSKPIVFQIHHINGNPEDNRVENLQLLCPNCHSQTDTFCNRARKES